MRLNPPSTRQYNLPHAPIHHHQKANQIHIKKAKKDSKIFIESTSHSAAVWRCSAFVSRLCLVFGFVGLDL